MPSSAEQPSTPIQSGICSSSVPSESDARIEVTYTFSHEDYLHFIDFWVKRNRRRYIRRIIRTSLTLWLGYLALFLMSNFATVHAAVLAAILATISSGAVFWVQRRHRRRVREDVLGERATRIGPEGIFGRFPHFEVLNYWKGISEIAEDNGYFFFFTGGSRAHVVPKRAFASASDLEHFREAATAYWKSNRG